jgi:hypothetical protein
MEPNLKHNHPIVIWGINLTFLENHLVKKTKRTQFRENSLLFIT